MIILFVFLLWVCCGIIAAGILFAYFQRKYPSLAVDEWREDLGFSLFVGLFGPISLLVSFFATGFCKYGWKLKP